MDARTTVNRPVPVPQGTAAGPPDPGARRADRPLGMVAVAVVALAVALAADTDPAHAESTPPPVPSGVTATSTGQGGNPADIEFDAEGGALSGISSSTNAWTSTAAARNGNRGLRVSSTAAPAYARWGTNVVPQDNGYAATRFWVRVTSARAGESVDLVTIANTRATRNFDLFLTDDRHFKWDLYRENADQSGFAITYGRWYLIEARVSYQGSNHTAQVRIDGVDQGTIASTGSNAKVSTVTIGSYAPKTHAQDYDDLAVEVGTQALGWLPPPAGGASGVEVRWSPVVDSGSGLREYEIWRNGRWYGWVPAGTTTFLDTAPVAGARYQVRAVDNDLNRSSWSAPANVTNSADDLTPPPTPRNPSVRWTAGGTATLTWSAVTDSGGSGLREYAIFRNGRWYGWVPASTTSFVDSNPHAGDSYRVRAYDQALNRSGWSSPVTL